MFADACVFVPCKLQLVNCLRAGQLTLLVSTALCVTLSAAHNMGLVLFSRKCSGLTSVLLMQVTFWHLCLSALQASKSWTRLGSFAWKPSLQSRIWS